MLLWLGWQAQRIGWNVWGRGSCCPPGLHCRTAPAPAAPQRPRRSTAPARRAMGMLHPVQYNTQVKQAAAAGPHAQAPDVPSHALPSQSSAGPAAGSCIVAAQQFFQQNPTQRRYADPARAACRRAALARLGPSALAGTSGAGVAVARQAYTAELPQHQQHHKGPGAAQRSARRAMGMLHPVQYNTQVKQAAAAGRTQVFQSRWPRSAAAAGSAASSLRSSFFNKTYAAAIR